MLDVTRLDHFGTTDAFVLFYSRQLDICLTGLLLLCARWERQESSPDSFRILLDGSSLCARDIRSILKHVFLDLAAAVHVAHTDGGRVQMECALSRLK